MSAGPPAANGTISLTGRAGYSCASAGRPDITASPATSIPTTRNMKPPRAAPGIAWSRFDQRVIYYGAILLRRRQYSVSAPGVMLSSGAGGDEQRQVIAAEHARGVRLRRLGGTFRRRMLQPGLFLELLLDVAAQSALHLGVIELPLPLRNNDGRDAVADEIGERARLRHEAV